MVWQGGQPGCVKRRIRFSAIHEQRRQSTRESFKNFRNNVLSAGNAIASRTRHITPLRLPRY
jgi:hypothetical protein